ncbi:uncharacterized protein FFMR_13534 [Fusarium fujikuroi]|nr:uncharacterized protein FFM5_11350 [Fusarium fujikuroi]SCO56378.1 uncharacterized protein FFMR_13534 [Fusarium fujikuroi]SCV42303.1 uncharacterized protein FFB14_07684 [Fusarium fujikuroi]
MASADAVRIDMRVRLSGSGADMKLMLEANRFLRRKLNKPQTNLSEAITGPRFENSLLRVPVIAVRLSPATTIHDP